MNFSNSLQFSLFPEGLEKIPIQNNYSSNYSLEKNGNYYVIEKILIKALKKICELHFKSTNLKIDKFDIHLRPEPKNLAYYFKYETSEGLVVLANNDLRIIFGNEIQKLLELAQDESFKDLYNVCFEDLRKHILTEDLKIMKLKISQEKSYMTQIFQRRYCPSKKIIKKQMDKKTGISDVSDQIKKKMQIISFIKYFKALQKTILINHQNQNINNVGDIDIRKIDLTDRKTLNQMLVKDNFAKILDLGCGTNGPEFFREFNDIDYIGLDLINSTHTKTKTRNLRIYRTDFEKPNIELRNEKYPLILAINSLETSTRPWLVMKKIEKWLTDDGCCILIFNQYEGSFINTGNPFSLEELITYCGDILHPTSGSIMFALDSPTKRDYLIALSKNKSSTNFEIHPKLELCESLNSKMGDTIANISFK